MAEPAIPADARGWRALNRAGQPPAWKSIALGSGGSVWERDGITAAIVPRAPERSVFNSVFYDDGAPVIESLDEIAAAYEQAGVNAWTVWVPEEDTRTAAALERAGHVLDSVPRYMGMRLDELRDPGPVEGFTFREELDLREVARINEIAYGYPPGDFDAVADSPFEGMRGWFADLGGEPACTLIVMPIGTDAVPSWVAALPEARGRGIGGSLLARALTAARDEDGMLTTTLQATKLGSPVYTRIGYRDFGAGHMWERRKAA